MIDNRNHMHSHLHRLIDSVLTTLITLIVVLMLVSIVFRYFLNESLTWSEELVRYLFVWMILLGSAVAFRDQEHIRVDYFLSLCSPRAKRVLEFLILTVVVTFYVATVTLGALWVWETSGTETSALRWPLNWCLYAALPVSSGLGLLFAAARLYNPPRDSDSTQVTGDRVKGAAK